jgi:hypothetical protein
MRLHRKKNKRERRNKEEKKTHCCCFRYNTTAHFVKADAIDTALFLTEKKGVNPLVVVPADPKVRNSI